MFFVVVLVLGRSALCINVHRTQSQSLKHAPLAFYEKFPVWKSCHFGRYFEKRSHQTDRCIARTNCYSALPKSVFLMQLAPGFHEILKLFKQFFERIAHDLSSLVWTCLLLMCLKACFTRDFAETQLQKCNQLTVHALACILGVV